MQVTILVTLFFPSSFFLLFILTESLMPQTRLYLYDPCGIGSRLVLYEPLLLELFSEDFTTLPIENLLKL